MSSIWRLHGAKHPSRGWKLEIKGVVGNFEVNRVSARGARRDGAFRVDVKFPTQQQRMHTNGHTERNAISSNTNYLQSKEIALLQTNPQMNVIRDPTKLMRLCVAHLTTKHCLQPPTRYGLNSECSFKQSGFVARQNQISFNAFQKTPFLHKNPKSH